MVCVPSCHVTVYIWVIPHPKHAKPPPTIILHIGVRLVLTQAVHIYYRVEVILTITPWLQYIPALTVRNSMDAGRTE